MALHQQPVIKVLPHHERQEICSSRAKYRDGRKDTAVKVYTINQESVYLLIQGVPAVGAQSDLQALCEQYGVVDYVQPLDEYPCEEFTEVYIVKYHWFPASRTAKKHLDDKSFFGGTLHVCYAPEFETISDTRLKLQERRKYVAWKSKSGSDVKNTKVQNKTTGSNMEGNKPLSQVPPLQKTGSHNSQNTSCEPVTYIWAGKEYTVYPQPTEQCNESQLENLSDVQQPNSSQQFLPRQLRAVAQKISEVPPGSSVENALNVNYKPEKELSTENPSITKDSFSISTENIKKKLYEVAVPNARVSFKRRKRI